LEENTISEATAHFTAILGRAVGAGYQAAIERRKRDAPYTAETHPFTAEGLTASLRNAYWLAGYDIAVAERTPMQPQSKQANP
jgi:hypothetical protein